MNRLTVPLAVLSLATMATAARPARADDAAPAPPLHAIGAITVGGTAEAPLGAALRAAANEGLAAGGAALVPPDTVGRLLGAVPELASCATADCHTRLASAVGAVRLVTIAVDAKGELYALTITLLDSRGRALRRRVDECVACAVPELQERVTHAVRDALAAGGDDSVQVTIDARPAASELEVDGTRRGATPWQGELVAGPHRVTATDAAGASIAQEIFVEAIPDQRFVLAIPRRDGHRRWGSLTYVVAGAGVATILGGAVLLSKDGDGTCDAAGTCPREYETTAGGALTIGAGVALLGAAGWMYWRDRRGERSLTIAPTATGAAARLSITF